MSIQGLKSPRPVLLPGKRRSQVRFNEEDVESHSFTLPGWLIMCIHLCLLKMKTVCGTTNEAQIS